MELFSDINLSVPDKFIFRSQYEFSLSESREHLKCSYGVYSTFLANRRSRARLRRNFTMNNAARRGATNLSVAELGLNTRCAPYETRTTGVSLRRLYVLLVADTYVTIVAIMTREPDVMRFTEIGDQRRFKRR